jgi:tetratricopeptide (TPR) repeat protein
MTSHFEKGSALYDMNRYEAALAEFGFARTEMPDDSRPVMLAAFCQYYLGQYKTGLALAKEALSLEPDEASNLHIFAICSFHMNKPKQAREAMDRALALDPEKAFSHYYMAWFMGNTGHWKVALSAIENALSYDPDNSDFLAFRSQALTKLGRRADAKDSSIQALQLNPDDPNALGQLGVVLRQEGDVVGSMRAFRDALRNDPNDEQARLGLLEAIRSRFIFYRWLLNFELQVQRISPQFRGGITFLPFLSLRALSRVSQSEMDPTLKVVLMTVGGLYFLFLFSLWFGPVILDALSAVDPELSQVLTRKQRVWSVSLLWTFIIGFCCVIAGVGFSVDPLLLIGVVLVLTFVMLGAWYRQNTW